MSSHAGFHEDFERALVTAKVGLILFFILVTVVYQMKYRKVKSANTFFGDPKTRLRVIGDACLTGLLGAASTAFVILSRGGIAALKQHKVTLVIVFIILALFGLSQESSGFNRWLAREETAKGEGAYAELDGTLTEEGRAAFAAQEAPGEPFVDSLATTSMVLVGIFVLYNTFKMMKASYEGYKSNQFSISTSKAGFGKMGPKAGFMVEVAVVVLLNALAPILSVKIRGEHYNKQSALVATGIALIAATLQPMLQYSGFLQF